MPEIGLPDDEITTWVDVTAFADRKFAALGAHASQEETMPFLSMGVERFAGVMGVETFVRVDEKHRRAVPGDRPVRRPALNPLSPRGRGGRLPCRPLGSSCSARAATPSAYPLA